MRVGVRPSLACTKVAPEPSLPPSLAGMRAASRNGLWPCPRCGVKLLSRGLSHACGPHSVEKFLERASPRARALFARFVKLIAACGPYEVAPAKTRVAFMALVRFASVNQLRTSHIDVHFVLPQALASLRFRRIEQLGKLYVHHLRCTDPNEMDAELQTWLRQSYREYGQRRWLAGPPERGQG